MLEKIEVHQLTAEATGVVETFSTIKTWKSGVGLLDPSPPDGSGVELLRSIRPLSHGPAVIVLTANTDPRYRKSCLGRRTDSSRSSAL